jgi:hypothetical protein
MRRPHVQHHLLAVNIRSILDRLRSARGGIKD